MRAEIVELRREFHQAIGEQAGRFGLLERQLTSVLIHGRQPSSPPPSPPSAAREAGQRLRRISRLIQGAVAILRAIWFLGPYLMLMATAAWKWLLPYLGRWLGW